jgi:hypothetical protein
MTSRSVPPILVNVLFGGRRGRGGVAVAYGLAIG